MLIVVSRKCLILTYYTQAGSSASLDQFFKLFSSLVHQLSGQITHFEEIKSDAEVVVQ